ncbi:polysaccharide pyruvyl transferase family protein [Leucobacter sp. W1038]|uniref:polysaccharide pyruvyl transferase family protein n=1 Tax=Leucobacter sp. W1038 TaxID=3438281 RepID=UPI003D960690
MRKKRHILVVSADRTDHNGGPANLGDAFLTDAFAGALRREGLEVTVVDFGAKRITGGASRAVASGPWELWRLVRESDAVVLGGGTLLQDDTPNRLIGGLPRLCFVVTALARLARRPVAFFGVGCDTVHRPVAKMLLRAATFGVPIWVREESSAGRLQVMFRKSAFVAADLALLTRKTRSKASDPAAYVIVALNYTEVPQLTSSVLDELEAEGPVTFISMDQRAFEGDYLALSEEGRQRTRYRDSVTSWEDAWKVLSGAKVVVASRMHALYMAALLGIPMVALGNREKIVAFAEEFKVPRIEKMNEFVPGLAKKADPEAVGKARSRVEISQRELLSLLGIR